MYNNWYFLNVCFKLVTLYRNNPWLFKSLDYRKVGELHLGLDKDRERRLASTGKWFEPGVKTKTNIWSVIVLPIILIISLLITVFIALN